MMDRFSMAGNCLEGEVDSLRCFQISIPFSFFSHWKNLLLQWGIRSYALMILYVRLHKGSVD